MYRPHSHYSYNLYKTYWTTSTTIKLCDIYDAYFLFMFSHLLVHKWIYSYVFRHFANTLTLLIYVRLYFACCEKFAMDIATIIYSNKDLSPRVGQTSHVKRLAIFVKRWLLLWHRKIKKTSPSLPTKKLEILKNMTFFHGSKLSVFKIRQYNSRESSFDTLKMRVFADHCKFELQCTQFF